MHHSSFDTALIALCLPMCPFWLLLAGIGTIVSHHGSTALVILAVQALFYCNELRIDFIVAPILMIPAWLFRTSLLAGMDDRIHAWWRYMHAWSHSPWTTITFGAGPGSFAWISMMVDEMKPPVFLYMHNDFLQILFEYGIVGLVLLILFLGMAMKRVPKALLLSIIVFGITYSPLHFFPSEFLIGLIILEGIRNGKSLQKNMER